MKRISCLHFVLLIVAMLGYVTIYAQQYHLQNMWQHSTPGSITYKTFEDSKGYLWFLTNEGIARYDGKNTRNFTDKDGYDDVGSFHVVESKSGTLYFVTINFDVFAFSNGTFSKVKTPGLVAWIDKDSSGNILLFYREQSLVTKVNPDNSLTKIVTAYLPYRTYMGMHLANDSFLISTHLGLWIVNSKTSTKILTADTYKDFVVARMFRTKEHILLTGEAGIYVLTGDMKAKLLYRLKNTEVYGISEDVLTKDLWVASSKGLQIFKNGIHHLSEPAHVSQNTDMLHVMQSKNNSFWISSGYKGIYVTNPRTKHITTKDGLLNDQVVFISQESGRILYFGRDNVYYEKEANGIKKHWLGSSRSRDRVTKQITRIMRVNDTTLYLYGINTYFIRKGKIYSESHTPGIRNNMKAESYNHLLYARSSDGAITVDDTMNVLITESRKERIRRDAKAKDIFLNAEEPACIDKDTVYYAASNKLFKVYWKGEEPVYKYWNINGKVSHVIRHGNVIHVSTYTHGFYLVAGDSIRNIKALDGLLSNFCRKSYLYKGRIWIATNQGISRINSLNPLELTNFTQPDYLIDNEVNDLFFMNDTVYVATSSGVTIFAEDIVYTRNVPQVFIERLQINNRDTIISNHYRLPYTHNNFTFHFSSPDYRSTNNTLFRFIISQNNRTDTAYYTSGIIQLSSLMPADYSFSISAKNIDGIWSKPVEFSLSILPPLWRTWWFITLGLLIIIGASATLVFFSLSRHRQQQAYKIKMVESELRSLRLYMNPHFIFNSLSSLQSFILTYQNKDAELFIAKFSKLIRSVMSFSQRGEITLEEEITLLTNYLELEKVRFKDRFDFSVTASGEIDKTNIVIPSLLIQPFAENAIKHGFSKLGGRKGILSITFTMEGEHLYCTVTDNGKGRQPAAVSSNHISSGISFTEERLRLIIQDPKQEVIRLTDLESEGKPAGLKVIIYVPILNNADK